MHIFVERINNRAKALKNRKKELEREKELIEAKLKGVATQVVHMRWRNKEDEEQLRKSQKKN